MKCVKWTYTCRLGLKHGARSTQDGEKVTIQREVHVGANGQAEQNRQ